MKKIHIKLSINEVRDIVLSFGNRYLNYHNKWIIKTEKINSNKVKLEIISKDKDIIKLPAKHHLKCFYIELKKDNDTTFMYIKYRYNYFEILFMIVLTLLLIIMLGISVYCFAKNPHEKDNALYILSSFVLSVLWIYRRISISFLDRKRFSVFNEILEKNFFRYL